MRSRDLTPALNGGKTFHGDLLVTESARAQSYYVFKKEAGFPLLKARFLQLKAEFHFFKANFL